LPVVVYGGGIFYLSSLSQFPEQIPSFWGFDKALHFVEYYIFGYLICRCFSAKSSGDGQRPASIAWTVAIGGFYALTDEGHQSFVPGRETSFWDFLFDFLGLIVAGVTFAYIRHRVRLLRIMENRLARIVKIS